MQHSGRFDADTAIVELVRARGYAERTRTVVVTDDRQLSDRVRYVGVLVRRLDWLVDQLARPNPAATVATAPARAAHDRSAHRPAGAPRETTGRHRWWQAAARARCHDTHRARPRDAGPEPWKPGRGATSKRGNPRKAPKGPSA